MQSSVRWLIGALFLPGAVSGQDPTAEYTVVEVRLGGPGGGLASGGGGFDRPLPPDTRFLIKGKIKSGVKDVRVWYRKAGATCNASGAPVNQDQTWRWGDCGWTRWQQGPDGDVAEFVVEVGPLLGNKTYDFYFCIDGRSTDTGSVPCTSAARSAQLVLAPNVITVSQGAANFSLIPTARDVAGNHRAAPAALTWVSNTPGVATVNNSGTVNPVAVGTTIIVVDAPNYKADSTTVRVVPANPSTLGMSQSPGWSTAQSPASSRTFQVSGTAITGLGAQVRLDAGAAYVFGASRPAFYAAAQWSPGAINPATRLSDYHGGRRFAFSFRANVSFLVGLMVTDPADSTEYRDYLAAGSPVLGLSARLSRTARLSGGVLIYRKPDANDPFSDRTVAAPFIAFSVDNPIFKVLGSLGSTVLGL